MSKSEIIEKLRNIKSRKEGVKLIEEYLAKDILQEKEEEAKKVEKGSKTIKIFGEKELKTELDEIDFGKVEAGASKTLVVYLKNTTKANLTYIKVTFPEIDAKKFNVRVKDAPTQIPPEGMKPLTLNWSPSLKLREALVTKIKVTGTEVYSPKK